MRTSLFQKKISDIKTNVHIKNKFMTILFVIFLFGMIYGALLVSQMSESEIKSLEFITQGFIRSRAEQSLISTFFSSAYSSGILVLLLFLLGFFAIGQPISLFVPLFRGLGLGLSVGFLYSTYGLKGVAYTVVLILPYALLTTISILIATKESIRFSNMFFRCLLPDSENTVSLKALRLYCIKFGIIVGLILIASFIDCLFTFLFVRFFIL